VRVRSSLALGEDFESVHWGDMEIGGPRHIYRERRIVRFFQGCSGDRFALEAGCGSGTLSLKLVARGCQMVSIDLSRGFVNRLYEKVTSSGLQDKLLIVRGSVTHLPLRQDLFDAVFSGEVLEHIPDDQGAVREYYRVLRSGGTCIITVPCNPRLWTIADNWAGHCRRYTTRMIEGTFETAGFVIKGIRYWGFPLLNAFHRLVFVTWVKRAAKKKSAEQIVSSKITKAGVHPFTSKVLSYVFELDSLFGWSSKFAIGLILKARKP